MRRICCNPRICILLLSLIAFPCRAVQTTFHFNPGFLLLGGFGGAVDFELSDDVDLGVGFMLINMDEVQFQGIGFRYTRFLGNIQNRGRFYGMLGAGTGGLQVEFADEKLKGQFLGVHAIVGRQWQSDRGLQFRIGVGLGAGHYSRNGEDGPSLSELFTGVQPRAEMQISFSPSEHRQRMEPRTKW